MRKNHFYYHQATDSFQYKLINILYKEQHAAFGKLTLENI